MKTTIKGFRKLFRRRDRDPSEEETDLAEDVHFHLMKSYKEVPEWWYGILLVIAMVVGMLGVGLWDTHTSPVVVVYGIIMPLIAILPCGIVQMVTGIAIPLQVLAQFIGGSFAGGSGVALMFISPSVSEITLTSCRFFKSYGYISMYQALAFSNDLKLAHYIKIPPRATFVGQVWATLVNTFVAASLFNFQMSFKGVCTPEASFKFTCPGQYSALVKHVVRGKIDETVQDKRHSTRARFSGVRPISLCPEASSCLAGTLGPSHLFGAGKRYNLLLLGFPIGVMLPIGEQIGAEANPTKFLTAHLLIRRSMPRREWIRQIHPVMIAAGPANWGSPYNFSYFWPNVMVAVFSFQYIRKKYTAFWAKYNYVIAASFPAGIAVAALVIFFGLELPAGGLAIDWWGNSVSYEGCEGSACTRFPIPDKGYFGPDPGHYEL